VHCPQGSGGGFVAALVVTAVALGLLAQAAPFLPAVTLAILGMCAAGCEVLRRAVKYGRPLRPVAAAYSRAAPRVMRELPAPRKAIGAPHVIPGKVLASRERIGR
jgi:hypothetical protein